jgi:two-component system OmpR family sensor kinase
MSPALGRLKVQPVGNWTLRARIIASLLGLLVVMCVAIGTFTDLALKHYLVARLDDQVTLGQKRVQRSVGNQPPPGGANNQPSRLLLPPGSPVGSVGARFTPVTSSVLAYTRDQNNDYAPIPATAVASLASVPADGRAHTVSLPSMGQYRAAAVTEPDGALVVTGLPLSGVTATLTNLTLIITALSAAALLVAAFIAAFIVRLALRPLRRVTVTASRVAELPLDTGEVALAERVPAPNPHTEVGQVGVALNRMLENVSDALTARHQSETRVRQFVADASHELRTPLASIRGYAELTRRSRQQVPEDVVHAMSRVESEASRMTTLVEDLLLLARLDAGRPLESQEVDVTRLIVDVTSDAHVAGRDHAWHLQLPDDPVLISGDEARLHQVLANLLANARAHTPAGTNVWISLSKQAGLVTIGIRDDGPGIPSQRIGDIFERFSRGEESRSRSAGSTGLGLAIVAAVVAAHGGQISVSSQPGQTAFTVVLPVEGVRPLIHGPRQAIPQTDESLTPKSLEV